MSEQEFALSVARYMLQNNINPSDADSLYTRLPEIINGHLEHQRKITNAALNNQDALCLAVLAKIKDAHP